MTNAIPTAAGTTSSVAVKKWSDPLVQPKGTTLGLTPKEILNTVRVPLSAFSGVDLTAITQVTLQFKTGVGSVLMTDLAFND